MAGTVKVLIVDDDVNYADTTVDLLNEKGFDCIGVHSGREAMDKVKEVAFDVILLDVRMPVMNGVETYRELKKISPQTVIIFVTAYRADELAKDALREGAYGLVHKPVDIDRHRRSAQATAAFGLRHRPSQGPQGRRRAACRSARACPLAMHSERREATPTDRSRCIPFGCDRRPAAYRRRSSGLRPICSSSSPKKVTSHWVQPRRSIRNGGSVGLKQDSQAHVGAWNR